MIQSKKVVIFIVEGITDEISIGNIVTKLNKDNKVFFQIVNKDITSDYTNNSSNIINKIDEQVKISIREQYFKKRDVIGIVHIVDMDGAFANEDSIVYKDIKTVEYDSEHIYTNNTESMKERNLRKSQILNKLISTKIINGIPYEIYYFSTNLEHVLHNIQNPKDAEKQKLAENFQDRFYDNPEKFIEFISNKEYAVNGTYSETWKYIKKENNSLKRYTNFNLWFSE